MLQLTQSEKNKLIYIARHDVELAESFDIDMLDDEFIKDIDIKDLNIDDYVYAVFNLLKNQDMKNHPFINQYGGASKMQGSLLIQRLNIEFKNGIVYIDINIGNVGIVRDVVFYAYDILN
jgi:hypothetical protein